MKKIIGAALVGILLCVWGAEPALARSASRLRWEGAAITLGALGFLAVLNEVAQARTVVVPMADRYDYYEPSPYPAPRYVPPRPYYPEEMPGRVWIPGHWEETEVWVPLRWETVWVWDADRCDERLRYDRRGRYGRYDRYDRWERRRVYDDCRGGRYERRPFGGHFERRRVWREGYYR